MLLLLKGNVPIRSRWKDKRTSQEADYVNCIFECYWALCRSKGVCLLR
jgi:hypothetical protein